MSMTVNNGGAMRDSANKAALFLRIEVFGFR